MVSITFDDGFISQYQNALPILQAAGYKAGFYIITSYPGSIRPGYMNWDQIRTLAGAGHEIGSHTRTHPRLTTLSPSQLQSEIAGSKADLVAQSVGSDTFVYPNADMSPAVINAVKDAGYVAARGGNFGLESTLADKHNLSSIHPDAYSTLPVIKQDIDQALADKRWLILVFHDVVTSGGTGNAVTPAFLQGVVDYLKQKNVPVVTLSEGASQLAQ
jgi:peptidoglycan/xylan/chitin deacetylase (PgdA/CDA1 family)